MERRRLKTILIIILAFLNGFLLFSLIQDNLSQRKAREQTEEQLVALFASDGLTLDPACISYETPPGAYSLSRDPALESEVAAFFLGGELHTEESGGLRSFSSGSAVALFSPNGSFTVTGLSSADAEKTARRFCRTFSYEDPVETAAGEFSALARYGEFPVYNASVVFRCADNTLESVTGTLLPQNGAQLSYEFAPLSSSGALTAFQAMRRETWAVASTVSGVSLCYALHDGDPLTLVPAWKISTDAISYYVNCITGSVSAN